MHHRPRKVTALARLTAAGSIAAAAVITSVAVVNAYPAPASTATMQAGCTSVVQGSTSGCQLTFTLRDSGGQAVNGSTVTWSTSGVAGASVNPSSSVTGTSGTASATFLPGSNECGKTATVTGTAQIASAQTQISVTCASPNFGNIFNRGLGNEGTDGQHSAHTTLVLGLGGAVLALALVGGAVVLRRRA